MLDYEKELKNFKPSLEVEEIEDAVYQEDLSDMTDLLKQVMDYGEIDELYGENPAPVKLLVQ